VGADLFDAEVKRTLTLGRLHRRNVPLVE
jgi:hypothetical protein